MSNTRKKFMKSVGKIIAIKFLLVASWKRSLSRLVWSKWQSSRHFRSCKLWNLCLNNFDTKINDFKIAKDNRRPMLLGRLVVEGASTTRGSLKALLSSSLRRTTLLLWFIWMACAFCYYGLVLMVKFNLKFNFCKIHEGFFSLQRFSDVVIKSPFMVSMIVTH